MFKLTRSNDGYIPALSFHSLTPFYDPLLQWVMQEQRFKRLMVSHANIGFAHNVLDIGCGTGTLTRMVKHRYPEAIVTGLDIDPAILAIAQHKAAGLAIQWTCATATELPYPDNSYERVVTSLVLHHLSTSNKQRAIAEIYRVLRPGGQLHVVDFGPPHSPYARSIARLMRHLEEVADNLDGYLTKLFAETGFNIITESAPVTTLFGDLFLYAIEKPPSPAHES